jgi:hypothetical protein
MPFPANFLKHILPLVNLGRKDFWSRAPSLNVIPQRAISEDVGCFCASELILKNLMCLTRLEIKTSNDLYFVNPF